MPFANCKARNRNRPSAQTRWNHTASRPRLSRLERLSEDREAFMTRQPALRRAIAGIPRKGARPATESGSAILAPDAAQIELARQFANTAGDRIARPPE
jgi:hypothetical protein